MGSSKYFISGNTDPIMVSRLYRVPRDRKGNKDGPGVWVKRSRVSYNRRQCNIFLRLSLHVNEVNSFSVSIPGLWLSFLLQIVHRNHTWESFLSHFQSKDLKWCWLLAMFLEVWGGWHFWSLPIYDISLLWPQSLVQLWACAPTWANNWYFKISLQISEEEKNTFFPDSSMEGYKSRITSNCLATTWSLKMNQDGGTWSWEIEKE